jgi:hypothetical protein
VTIKFVFVKPANQLSRRSSEVPVLPATTMSPGNFARTVRPVPRSITCTSAWFKA